MATNGRPGRLLVALAGLAISAAACDAGGPANRERAPEIEPGVCVASETKDQGHLVPDLSTIVSCRSPHAYEVYDIIDLPDSALTGSTRQERIDNRDDLALPAELPDDSTQRQAYEEFAERECATSLQRVSGFDEVKLGGASAEDAQVEPALHGINATWSTVMPEKEWLDGRRQVLCSARFEGADNIEQGRTPVKPQASANDRMIITRVDAPSLPLEFRQCRAYDKKRHAVSAASCTEPHVDEALLYFEADGVFGKTFMKSIQKRPTPKKFNRFDKVCTDALPQILGPDYDDKTVRGFGSVAKKWTEDTKTVRCSVGAIKFRARDLAPGSLVGTGAEKIELVRAP